MLDERSVQTAATTINIFKNKGNVEAMLNESLNQFDLTHFQQAFNIFFARSTMLNDLFKRPRYLVQQSVERMLKQMLRPFKRAFTIQYALYTSLNDDNTGLGVPR